MSRWHLALLGEVEGHIVPPGQGVAERIRGIQILLERPYLHSRQIAVQADEAEGLLAKWDILRPEWGWDKGKTLNLMKVLTRPERSDSWNWEEATQRYLALSALAGALRAPTEAQRQPIEQELLALAKELAFPPNYSGPKAFFAEDRKAERRKHFQAILEELGK
jgi:hypothetical protein